MYGRWIDYIRKDKVGRWMAALGIGLFAAVLCCVLQVHRQVQLSNKLLRLHVVANSDSVNDQRLKLQVRDTVLAQKISRVPTVEEMRRVEKAAQQCLQEHGSRDPVTIAYTRMYFETRTYPGFALPAGNYHALRVVIGEGKGRNWWCVVYPALCTDLASAEAELTADEIALIRKNGKKFLVRFKISEWIGELSQEIFAG